ncbi:arsenite efflux transporter metallochaperone ArsD [Lysinibacillus capsici]|nr:arsenite efflux transporter metallochaperone ArsD [Lysinibacillus sp. FN11]UYB45192.1 arsenite efflux transporter metallochaperone ArsD [Lysinibacillus capsici]
MKKIHIYEPAMCCSTGLCGPSIDPELLRMSFIMNNLKKTNIEAERFNLTNEPNAFVENEAINQLLMSEGIDALPATFVDGELLCKGIYPTNEQFSQWSGLFRRRITTKAKSTLVTKRRCVIWNALQEVISQTPHSCFLRGKGALGKHRLRVAYQLPLQRKGKRYF